MNESQPRISDIEVPDAEVELSAQDLRDLSAACENNQRAQEPFAKAMTAIVVPSAPAFQQRPAPTPARRAMARVAAPLTFAVAAIGALYFAVASNDDASRSAALESAPTAQVSASAAKSEGKPVKFANPFDAKEVFEFPAGTSNAQARDAVAEILMERAMQRQRKFDARVSSNL